MKHKIRTFAFTLAVSMGTAVQADIAIKENVSFFSEAVACRGNLFLPEGFGVGDRTMPAVVLAPTPGETQADLAGHARMLAANGIVAFTFDYRGWGQSGGFLYFGEPVRWDDRLRFTPMTATMRVRRGRTDPRAQVIDIRNALTYLQGEKGVDRARIGVWGAELAGDHAIAAAGSDARVKVVVAQQPKLSGHDESRRAFAPNPAQQAMMVKLARTGSPPATQQAAKRMNEEEAQLALAEYRSYWYVEQIPPTTAVLFVGADADRASSENATEASKLLKGPAQVTNVPGAREAFDETAAKAAVDWFGKHL